MARSALLNVMVGAATKAGRALARDFGEVEQLQVSVKGPGDFVSAADKKAERTIVEELSKARPGYGFLAEESPAVEGTDRSHRWIIDPLDGTTNFLHGIPIFAISIALERDGQIVAGVVFNPVMDELYVAERGGGAFMNERRLRVAQRSALPGLRDRHRHSASRQARAPRLCEEARSRHDGDGGRAPGRRRGTRSRLGCLRPL